MEHPIRRHAPMEINQQNNCRASDVLAANVAGAGVVRIEGGRRADV